MAYLLTLEELDALEAQVLKKQREIVAIPRVKLLLLIETAKLGVRKPTGETKTGTASRGYNEEARAREQE